MHLDFVTVFTPAGAQVF